MALGALIDGSSPRMRGARCEEICKVCDDGIIPADAGSTTWQRVYVC